MSRIDSKAFKISIIAIMLSLTAVFELMNLTFGIRTPWGMSIDFVAIPVMIIFFILRTKYALLTGVGLMAIIFTIDGGNVFAAVGAVMKFSATISMILILGAFSLLPLKNERNHGLTYNSSVKFGFVCAIALFIRCIVAILMNYYFAIPFYTGIPIEQIIQSSLYLGSIWVFLIIYLVLNMIQGIIDLAVSWFIVFKVGLAKQLLIPKTPTNAFYTKYEFNSKKISNQ